MWIGGIKPAGEQWRWAGKSTEVMTAVLWDINEPGARDLSSLLCMGSWLDFSNLATGKFHDASCTGNTIPFICEKRML